MLPQGDTHGRLRSLHATAAHSGGGASCAAGSVDSSLVGLRQYDRETMHYNAEKADEVTVLFSITPPLATNDSGSEHCLLLSTNAAPCGGRSEFADAAERFIQLDLRHSTAIVAAAMVHPSDYFGGQLRLRGQFALNKGDKERVNHIY